MVVNDVKQNTMAAIIPSSPHLTYPKAPSKLMGKEDKNHCTVHQSMLSLILCIFNGKGVKTLEALSAFKELRS